MNGIDELEIQNLHDTWCILYGSLSKIFDKSTTGEALLRNAIRLYGSFIGRKELDSHMQNMIKPNVKNFFIFPYNRFYDPRLYVNKQNLNEQVGIFDVLRCPFANFFRKSNDSINGKIFCEEFMHSCFKEYSKDIAQVNISEMLSDKTYNYCRIAIYYRPGNVGLEEYKQHFDSFNETNIETNGVSQNKLLARKIWNENSSLLVEAFSIINNNDEKITNALVEAAEIISSLLEKHSINTNNEINLEFIRNNCSINIDCDETKIFSIFKKTLLKQLNI